MIYTLVNSAKEWLREKCGESNEAEEGEDSKEANGKDEVHFTADFLLLYDTLFSMRIVECESNLP